MNTNYPVENEVKLIQDFYQRLLEFDTNISDSNLFYVNYQIPTSVLDNLESFYQNIGETQNDRNIGIGHTFRVFNDNKMRAITVGVDLPKDDVSTKILNDTTKHNGYIPITVTDGRNYGSNELKTTFYDTNLSLNDLLFKPWIRYTAREGFFTPFGLTNINVVFLGKSPDFSKPLIRKVYTFYDCAPIDTENKDEYNYDENSSVIKQRVKWKFNRYDVRLANIQ